jgi:hypothetical protein
MMAGRVTLSRILIVWVAIFGMAAQPAYAHSRGMGTLDINGQGGRLMLTWVFYYDELPAQLTLPDGSGGNVSLGDPRTIKEALAQVGEAAFQLKAGAGKLGPPKVSQIVVLPDKTCLILLSYQSGGAGPVELQAPVLRLLPPNYLINARFMGRNGKIGSTLLDRGSPPLAISVGGGLNATPADNPFRTAFTMELGTAWVHTDWILLGIILLASRPVRRVTGLLVALVVLRELLVYLCLGVGFGIPWLVPDWLLCVPIIVMAALAARPVEKRASLEAATVCGALIYSAYDLQFLPMADRGASGEILAGYGFGFVAGLCLAIGLVFLIGREVCRSRQFQTELWRRRLCWATAGISLWMSLYEMMGK